MRGGRVLPAIALGAALSGAVACRPAPEGEAAPDDPGRAAVVRFWATLEEATRLRMSGEFARAVEVYERTLSLDPRHEDSLYYLGYCRREAGDATGARRAFARLVDVNPASARGHLALAALLVSPDTAGPLDVEGAESHLRRAHEINAEETGAMVRLAEVLIVRGDVAEAGTWLDAAARTNPRSVEAAFLAGYLRWEDGDGAGARAWLRRAIEAAQAAAPSRGVLGEGDRRGGAGQAAAPPLPQPMGRTLFGDLATPLRDGGPTAGLERRADRLYEAVREMRRSLASRQSSRTKDP
jgi:tetratricopeptide (TPR) repeat protein